MKSFLLLSALFGLPLFFVGCDSHAANTHVHGPGEHAATSLKLNDGARWKVDEHTRTSMAAAVPSVFTRSEPAATSRSSRWSPGWNRWSSGKGSAARAESTKTNMVDSFREVPLHHARPAARLDPATHWGPLRSDGTGCDRLRQRVGDIEDGLADR